MDLYQTQSKEIKSNKSSVSTLKMMGCLELCLFPNIHHENCDTLLVISKLSSKFLTFVFLLVLELLIIELDE